MRAWVSYRRSQGYRVSMVDVEDVFDEFNGGVPSARAVYRFARHFFLRGDAGALVLVGRRQRGPQARPRRLRAEFRAHLHAHRQRVQPADRRGGHHRQAAGEVPGRGRDGRRLPGHDHRPLPAGETGELEIMLNKVFAFEAPVGVRLLAQAHDHRRDDEYSEGSSTFGGFSSGDNNEAAFEAGQENAAQVIERALPARYDVKRFYLRTYTDDFYTTQCANRFAAIS